LPTAFFFAGSHGHERSSWLFWEGLKEGSPTINSMEGIAVEFKKWRVRR
jgi:hypothetical protein